MMNVTIPSDFTKGTAFSIFSLVLGVAFIVYGYINKSHKYQNFVLLSQELLCVFIGFFIALLPWGIKHISELPLGTPLSITYLLS